MYKAVLLIRRRYETVSTKNSSWPAADKMVTQRSNNATKWYAWRRRS